LFSRDVLVQRKEGKKKAKRREGKKLDKERGKSPRSEK